jgi:hypothetical protein
MSTAEHTAEVLAERLFDQALTVTEAAAVWLGHELGWYAALAAGGSATPQELAARTGTAQRYVREWLEGQAVSGILLFDDGRFTLPEGHAEALLDEDSPNWIEPLVRQMVLATLRLPDVARAARSGGGVPWEDFGLDMSRAQGDCNRPALLHALADEWVPQIPELAKRLAAGARVADIGCGEGWSAIGLAEAFPTITVDGFDVDAGALESAREHATTRGVADRVRFHQTDAGQGLPAGPYDVLLAVECVHDMPAPVQVLTAMREAAGADAVVVVIDEAAADEFTAPDDEVQRLLYGFSQLLCLPDSMSHAGSAATGSVMRPATLAGYASAAGFAGAEPLEVSDTGFWRCYRLPLGTAPS